MKDKKLRDILFNNLNVAEFISVYNGEIRYNCTNSNYVRINDIILDLIKRKGSVNIRSFSSDYQRKSTRFVTKLSNISKIIDIVRKNTSENLVSIINENIDINDGGVSGVILGDTIEFSPNDTPRCVEKEGVCSLPLNAGIEILNNVYGINLINEIGKDNISSHRIEFSIHLEPKGVLMKRYTIWEITKDNNTVCHNLKYPNNFSRIIGDKVFGLLVANEYSLLVPKSLVISRFIPPFQFGQCTSSIHQPKWTRTAPISKVSGKYHTSKHWEDPYILMRNEEKKGNSQINIASLIIQDGIDAIYSGAGVISKDKCIVEVVRGFGDSFMIGKEDVQPNSNISNLVSRCLHSKLLNIFGNCSFEWVADKDMNIWLVQVNQIHQDFDEHNIVKGKCSNYIDFNTSSGLEELRLLVSKIKGTNNGINLIGNVGITSHFGDILRINNIVSKISR